MLLDTAQAARRSRPWRILNTPEGARDHLPRLFAAPGGTNKPRADMLGFTVKPLREKLDAFVGRRVLRRWATDTYFAPTHHFAAASPTEPPPAATAPGRIFA